MSQEELADERFGHEGPWVSRFYFTGSPALVLKVRDEHDQWSGDDLVMWHFLLLPRNPEVLVCGG